MTQKEREYYEARLRKFVVWLKGRCYIESVPFEAKFRPAPGPMLFSNRQGELFGLREGDVWGCNWERGWFYFSGQVPQSWQGNSAVARLNVGGEGLIFTADGLPAQALSSGSVFEQGFTRERYDLYNPCQGGEKVGLWVHAAAHTLFGLKLEDDPTPDSPTRHGQFEARLERARLCLFEPALWHLALEAEVLFTLMLSLPEGDIRRARLLYVLNHAADVMGNDITKAGACREILAPELAKPANASALTLHAIGSAHIDNAWLWLVAVTRDKVVRTIANQVALLEKYPDYVFGFSQAVQLEMLKQDCPALFERVRQLVAEGRFEILAGMWVEPDCNVPLGESLRRQILYAKAFCQREFNVDVRICWLPDAFGYTAALPQILKQCGIDSFLSTKLHWNRFNPFPYGSFVWQGIDGSEVLAHFPPVTTYNSTLSPDQLVPAQTNFPERSFLNSAMALLGIGNGGGGPTEEHIVRGQLQADLEGAPRVKFSRAHDFFADLARHRNELPIWVGPLDLEIHRGTLTTQAAVKNGNRRLECGLRQLEFLSSCLPIGSYPAAALERIWKGVLQNQFHDVLPGSSIGPVYVETRADHQRDLAECQQMADQTAARIFGPKPNSLVLANTLSYGFTRPIALPRSWDNDTVADCKGKVVLVQQEAEGSVALVSVPPHSFMTLMHQEGNAVALAPIPSGDLVLQNGVVRYEFAADGTIIRAFDKTTNREIVAAGKCGNLLSLYADLPVDWDAWDIDPTYEKMWLENARPVKATWLVSGPVRQGLEFQLAIGNSVIIQRVYLAANSKRLDFETTVRWQERHRLLRVSFPVAVHAEEASFDIQDGFIRRPTHHNTLFERARYEVTAHRCVDLSDTGYGVALLNDGKYGHSAWSNVLGISLLRSPTNPDPEADLGEHHFTYSLLPHTGDLTHSDVMAEAAALNQGVMIFDGYRALSATLPCQFKSDGVVWDTLKRAEDGNGYILRLVETCGRRSSCRLTPNDPRSALVETDMLEQPISASISDRDLVLNPFKIRTFRLIPPTE